MSISGLTLTQEHMDTHIHKHTHSRQTHTLKQLVIILNVHPTKTLVSLIELKSMTILDQVIKNKKVDGVLAGFSEVCNSINV